MNEIFDTVRSIRFDTVVGCPEYREVMIQCARVCVFVCKNTRPPPTHAFHDFIRSRVCAADRDRHEHRGVIHHDRRRGVRHRRRKAQGEELRPRSEGMYNLKKKFREDLNGRPIKAKKNKYSWDVCTHKRYFFALAMVKKVDERKCTIQAFLSLLLFFQTTTVCHECTKVTDWAACVHA